MGSPKKAFGVKIRNLGRNQYVNNEWENASVTVAMNFATVLTPGSTETPFGRPRSIEYTQGESHCDAVGLDRKDDLLVS